MKAVKIILFHVCCQVVVCSLSENNSLRFLASKFPNMIRRVNKNDIVNISCETNNVNASVQLEINLPIGGYAPLSKHFSYNPSMFEQHGQTFSIIGITYNEGGHYQCNATYENEVKLLTLGKLTVSRAPCINTPVIQPDEEIFHYEIFDDISIICKAEGEKGNRICPLEWVRNGSSVDIQKNVHVKIMRDVFRDSAYFDRLQLTVDKAQKDNEGIYTCSRKVKNCYQETENSIRLIYTEPYKPKIVIPNTVKKEGDGVRLMCEVDASPKADISWLEGNKTVRKCLKDKKCLITINNVESQQKNYTCRAENFEGRSEKPAKIEVLVAPVVEVFSPLKSSLNSEMHCEVVKGNPLPFIYWQTDVLCNLKTTCKSKWANLEKHVKIKPDVNTPTKLSVLTFMDKSVNFKSIRCFATNSVGNATATAMPMRTNNDKQDSSQTTMLVIVIVGLLIVFSLMTFIIFILRCRNRMYKTFALHMKPDRSFNYDPDRTLFEQSIELPYEPEWEFPKERLELMQVIGSGAFGQVWSAHARGILALNPRDKKGVSAKRRRTRLWLNEKVPKSLLDCFLSDDMCDQRIIVAVKTLKAASSDVEYRDLASEIKVLIHLGEHQNIVNLLGACTRDGNLCAIIEYCPHGNLTSFLRSRRNIFSLQWAKQAFNFDEDFCWLDATHTALQIARGMLFLSEKRLVHRDLAARNVLVGPDYTMKLADFGLARDIYSSDVYIKESCGMLPVKWMAPESLFDKVYTVRSDVWSFGVVLWEICTMGGSPYPGLPPELLFEFITEGKRMVQPATCPDELYELMTMCWQERMEDRPWFHEIVSQLQGMIESKIVHTDNLAAFERLQSISDETAYLVPKSPCKEKKGSLDTLLGARNVPSKITRKCSADVIFNFPPTDCKEYELSPITEARYVDLHKSQDQACSM